MVCRGLDVNISGKVAKKNDSDMEKRSPCPQCVPPSYRCVRNLSPSMAKATATAYTHINVAVVTRSHFGNAKPKFQMNCWPLLAITTEAVSSAV